ncbi:hypothetical protein NHF46_15665 [Arthrobacter alpinus]|nr:hypothetical protein [Arthrobacter alpinus]
MTSPLVRRHWWLIAAAVVVIAVMVALVVNASTSGTTTVQASPTPASVAPPRVPRPHPQPALRSRRRT